jgi:predicted DNA-binding transcriptional regulator AlpA
MEAKPTPKAARLAVPGLRPEDLASKAGVSLSTVMRCERDGHWPRSIPMRRAYLAVLGLTEADVDLTPHPPVNA